MAIQDIGLWLGLGLFIFGIIFLVVIDAGMSTGATFSEWYLSYFRDSPPYLIGVGLFLAVISLVSLARSKPK